MRFNDKKRRLQYASASTMMRDTCSPSCSPPLLRQQSVKLSALRTSTRVAQGLSFFSPVVYCDGACVLFGEDGAFLPKQYRVHGISKHLKKSGNVPGDLVDRRVPSMHTKIIHHFLLLHSSYPPWHATVARNRDAQVYPISSSPSRR